MTISQFFQKSVRQLESAGIDTAALDVNVLVKFVLQKDDVFILLEPDMPLTNYQQAKLNKLISRREKGEPVAYLTNHKEFFGYDFYVDKRVLVPRPESEKLVELALDRIKLKVKGSKLKVLDMGTGSGCIIISLAQEIEKLSTLNLKLSTEFYASDTSSSALAVAKKNARNLLSNRTIEQSSNLRFYHSDLFSNRLLHKKYDILIANLPYVPKIVKSSKFKVKSISGTDFEPQNAIFAEDNGAAVIKKFLAEAKNYLARDGLILIELDPRNAKSILKDARKNFPISKIELSNDLAGLYRYLTIEQ